MKILLDGRTVEVSQKRISGRDLKAMNQIDAHYQLFLEQSGDEPDRLIRPQDVIVLKAGMRFYAVPPAIMAERVRNKGAANDR